MKLVHVIFFGRGGTLGNFEVFAQSLATQLRAEGKQVEVNRAERRSDFFRYLEAPPFLHTGKIAALHVFTHSIGAGLYLGYGDPILDERRKLALQRVRTAGLRLYFPEVLNLEEGAILTDHLLAEPYASMFHKLRERFAPKAFIKLWGCNSGVKGWVYSDNGVSDPMDASVPYYWRALNERNVPKPSIAQALAWYFKVPVHGASSGSHVEVRHHGDWLTSANYKASTGAWPPPALTHRLHPDRGEYHVYHP